MLMTSTVAMVGASLAITDPTLGIPLTISPANPVAGDTVTVTMPIQVCRGFATYVYPGNLISFSPLGYDFTCHPAIGQFLASNAGVYEVVWANSAVGGLPYGSVMVTVAAAPATVMEPATGLDAYGMFIVACALVIAGLHRLFRA